MFVFFWVCLFCFGLVVLFVCWCWFLMLCFAIACLLFLVMCFVLLLIQVRWVGCLLRIICSCDSVVFLFLLFVYTLFVWCFFVCCLVFVAFVCGFAVGYLLFWFCDLGI